MQTIQNELKNNQIFILPDTIQIAANTYHATFSLERILFPYTIT